jgi:hypothetical protein
MMGKTNTLFKGIVLRDTAFIHALDVVIIVI